MPPKPEDVWNDRLVRALQDKGGRSFQWERALKIIKAVKNDIYAFKTGRIVNLPKDLESQTVLQEVVGIVKGDRPLIPPEMEAYDPGRPGFVKPSSVEDLSQHPYLRRIDFRGGGYALLMAFERNRRSRGESFRGPLCRKQLIQQAQEFCKEPMDTDYHAGRVISGWKSMGTLVGHAFVEKLSKFAERIQQNYNHGPADEFRLTDKGARFIEEVLKKFPTEFHFESGSSARVMPSTHSYRQDLDMLNRFPQRKLTQGASPAKSSIEKSKNLFRRDEDELKKWLATAEPGNTKDFNIGKDRRQSLHQHCQNLGGLITASYGEGAKRTLVVTKTEEPTKIPINFAADLDRVLVDPVRAVTINGAAAVRGGGSGGGGGAAAIKGGALQQATLAPSFARGHRVGGGIRSAKMHGAAVEDGFTPAQRAVEAAQRRLEAAHQNHNHTASQGSGEQNGIGGNRDGFGLAAGMSLQGEVHVVEEGRSGSEHPEDERVSSGVSESAGASDDNDADNHDEDREERELQEAIRRSLEEGMSDAAGVQRVPLGEISQVRGGERGNANAHAHSHVSSTRAGGWNASEKRSLSKRKQVDSAQSAQGLQDDVVCVDDSDEDEVPKSFSAPKRHTVTDAQDNERRKAGDAKRQKTNTPVAAARGDCVDLCDSSDDDGDAIRDVQDEGVHSFATPRDLARQRDSAFDVGDSQDCGIAVADSQDGMHLKGCMMDIEPKDDTSKALLGGVSGAVGKCGVPLNQKETKQGADPSASSGQAAVRVLVDDMERIRNKDPRDLLNMIKTALDLMEEKPNLDKHRPVVMETLPVGDYMWEVVPLRLQDSGDRDQGSQDEQHTGEDKEKSGMLAGVVVERKKISDLVGRSLRGDHLKQIAVLRGLGLRHSFLLVEGPTDAAKRNRVFGLDCNEEATAGAVEGSSIVQTGEDIWEMYAWLMVSNKGAGGRGLGSVQVLQSNDEGHTARLIALLSSITEASYFDSGNQNTSADPRTTTGNLSVSSGTLLTRTELKLRLREVREEQNTLEKALVHNGICTAGARAVLARFGTARDFGAARELARDDEALFSIADLKLVRDQPARKKLMDQTRRLSKQAAASGVSSDIMRGSNIMRESDRMEKSPEFEFESFASQPVRELVLDWSEALVGVLRSEGQLVEAADISSEVCTGLEAQCQGWARMWCQCQRPRPSQRVIATDQVQVGERGEGPVCFSRSVPVVVVRLTGERVVREVLAAAERVGKGASAASVALESARSIERMVNEVLALTREREKGRCGGREAGGEMVEDGQNVCGGGERKGLEKEMVMVLMEGVWTACAREQRKGTQRAVVARLQEEVDLVRLLLTMGGGMLGRKSVGGGGAWQVLYTSNRKETAMAVRAAADVVHAQTLLILHSTTR